MDEKNKPEKNRSGELGEPESGATGSPEPAAAGEDETPRPAPRKPTTLPDRRLGKIPPFEGKHVSLARMRHPVRLMRWRGACTLFMKTAARTDKELKKFDKLQSVGEKPKGEIRDAFAADVRTRLRMQEWASFLTNVLVLLFVVAAILMVSNAGRAVSLVSPDLGSVVGLKDITPRLAVGTTAAIAFLYLPGILSSVFLSKGARQFFNLTRFYAYWFGLAFIVCCGFVLMAVYLPQPGGEALREYASGVALVPTFLVCFLIGIYPLASISVALDRRVRKLHPQAFVSVSFFDTLVMLESGGRWWGDPEFKSRLMSKIESVARCVEADLPRRLHVGEASSDAWIKEHAGEMAAGIRSMIKAVAAPREDSYERLKKRAADYLVHLLKGDWDAFPRLTPVKVSQPQLLRTRALQFLRAAAAAAFPLALLFVVYRWKLVPDPTVFGYLQVGAFVWAALGFIAQLDPDYVAKVTALKDIAGTFRKTGGS